jgi:pimeloyl-ACP methyl ester carboxylesterase
MAIALHTPLHYTVQGSGPDVLLVHGWASSGRMWSRLVDALAAHARFWSVDLYGFGASPRPAAGETVGVEDHAARLLDFCDRHGIRPLIVVGHSMGGMLALKLALARPDGMEKLVLISPVVSGRFGQPFDLSRLVISDWGRRNIIGSKTFWTAALDVVMPALATPGHFFLEAEVIARIQEDFKRSDWQAAAGALESIARENLLPRLGEIPHPALVIVGKRDMTVPPEEGRAAARRLPRGSLLELPKVNHQPLDEAPGPVIRAVDAFLTRPA